MRKIFYYTFPLLIMIGFYLIGAFFAWDLNPYHWQELNPLTLGGRLQIFVYVIIDIIFSIVVYIKD